MFLVYLDVFVTCHMKKKKKKKKNMFPNEDCDIDLFLLHFTSRLQTISTQNVIMIIFCVVHTMYILVKQRTQKSRMGVVGWCEGAVYLTSPGRPTDIGLQLGKACYPCSG